MTHVVSLTAPGRTAGQWWCGAGHLFPGNPRSSGLFWLPPLLSLPMPAPAPMPRHPSLSARTHCWGHQMEQAGEQGIHGDQPGPLWAGTAQPGG